MKYFVRIFFLLFSLSSITLPAIAADPSGSKSGRAHQPVVSTVNINTAGPEQIAQRLSGIGLARAKAIVAFRDKNGPFQRAADLAAVKGIGERTVELNQSRIRLK